MSLLLGACKMYFLFRTVQFEGPEPMAVCLLLRGCVQGAVSAGWQRLHRAVPA